MSKFEEFLAKSRGENLDTYRKGQALRQRIREVAEKYENTPPETWPPITFNWDTAASSQRFSLDGTSQADFEKSYPEGFCLGWVKLAEFDKKLCHFSRRDDGELWDVGSPDRVAYLIVYLSEGHPISPPLAKPLETNEVIFQGGHHRYAIANAVQEPEIPIHVEPRFKTEIGKIVPVRWENP